MAISLGAFGAHALEDTLSVQGREWWQTATFYLLTHGVAGLAIALPSDAVRPVRAGLVMICGAGLFAATLYAMALGAPRWMGAITPIGGIGMIAGWLAILIGALRSAR